MCYMEIKIKIKYGNKMNSVKKINQVVFMSFCKKKGDSLLNVINAKP